MLKHLPTSTATFRKIIEGDLLYIDKTQFIYQIVSEPTGAYFLSRPRRFGKSLLISTLEEVFQGNRDLFHGLWIDGSDYNWNKHPIIRFDFSQEPSNSAEALEDAIYSYLAEIAEKHEIELVEGPYYRQFRRLIQDMAKEKPVVILIDEYDKPVIDNIEDPVAAESIRDVLKNFYGVVKTMEQYVRMVFITGVSKFSKVSIFSELNHLEELTLDPRFATMLGITEEELTTYFAEHLQVFSEKEGLSVEDLLKKVEYWYDGFRFTSVDARLYNPFSTMNLFRKMSFQSFWFESGTPTFLIKLLHRDNYKIEEFSLLQVEESSFSTYEIENLEPIPLLFQTGYLTVKAYDPKTRIYTLNYPNYEVEDAFLAYLLDAFSYTSRGLGTSYLWRLIRALQEHNLEFFFEALKVLFANIDYDLQLDYEKYYQTIFYLIFKLMGLRIDAEVKTNRGRIDAVVELVDHIYLFEFKLDQDAAKALRQIQEHIYYEKYQLYGKPISCIGVNFNTKTRNVDDWEVKTL